MNNKDMNLKQLQKFLKGMRINATYTKTFWSSWLSIKRGNGVIWIKDAGFAFNITYSIDNNKTHLWVLTVDKKAPGSVIVNGIRLA